MRNRRGRTDAEPGQDSFLDIVANLVGILIILVMVVGARAKEALVELQSPTLEVVEGPNIDLASAQAAGARMEEDIRELARKIEVEQQAVAMRKAERDYWSVTLTRLEQTIDESVSKLSDEEQKAYQQAQSIASAQLALQEIRRQRSAVENSRPPKNVLEHIPTPLAKTVFIKEIHFRLKGGRIAYTPIEEFVEQFREEAPKKIWRLRSLDTFTETLGPRDGFRMKYTMAKKKIPINVGGGTVLQERAELEQFTLIPVSEQLGEPLTTALRPDSRFSAVLLDKDAKRVVVTVWVYPDSFNEFRALKQHLYNKGYLTASRPMPEGQLIGGSPNGSKSVTQ